MSSSLTSTSKLALLVAFAGVLGGLSCSWSDKDSEEFYSMLMIGTIIGAIFGIACVVVASLPLCCNGFQGMKEKGKIIAGVVITIGIIICFIPAITGKAQADAAVTKACDRCEAQNEFDKCKDEDEKRLKDAVAGLGIAVAYIHAFGFVVVILGVTAAGMGCCICCKCCKMADELQGKPAPQGAVVGSVVGKDVEDPTA